MHQRFSQDTLHGQYIFTVFIEKNNNLLFNSQMIMTFFIKKI